MGHYRGWLGFFRLDHQINDKNNLFFRSDLDGFHDTNPNGIVGGNSLPTVARIFRRRTYSEELGETAVLTPDAGQQSARAIPTGLADHGIRPSDLRHAVLGADFDGRHLHYRHFAIGAADEPAVRGQPTRCRRSWGRHQVKFGADVIVAHTGGNSKEFGGPSYLGVFSYNTCTQALTVCESAAYLDNIANVKTYTQSYGNANYTVNDALWALFVQDDFHVAQRSDLNLGLRYERQTFTDSRKDFAPRVGFAYNWHGDGKTVIRGGFGIYYSQIVDNSRPTTR